MLSVLYVAVLMAFYVTEGFLNYGLEHDYVTFWVSIYDVPSKSAQHVQTLFIPNKNAKNLSF